MARNSVFKSVQALHPPRNAFDLSRMHSFDCDAGTLIPVYIEEVVPGDTFKMANRILVRMAPMIAPSFTSWRVATWTFFVPNRLMFPHFPEFISGGQDGQQVLPIPRLHPLHAGGAGLTSVSQLEYNKRLFNLEGFLPFFCYINNNSPISPFPIYKWSFWDYAGFPMPLMSGQSYSYLSDDTTFSKPYIPNVYFASSSLPTFWPYSAYLFIYNEYFRDENLESKFVYAPTDLNQAFTDTSSSVSYIFYKPLDNYVGDKYICPTPPNFPNSILTKCWNKDYFTSALPFQQRGVAPAIPISGSGSLNFSIPVGSQIGEGMSDVLSVENLNTVLNQHGSANFTNLASVTVSDLRDIFQTQKWLERNARSGVRYNEYIYAHFGVHLRDERIQRPEYIGGTNSPIMISQVLQTSQTSSESPLGDYGGYGISADSTRIGDYYVREFGWIMTIMCIYPDITYHQGIHPRYTRFTMLDYFSPEFVNLSEQAVYTRELFAMTKQFDYGIGAIESDMMIFGYQGRFNEYRSSYDQVSGSMRDDSLGYYVTRRDFQVPPTLEPSFVHIQPEKLRGSFAVQSQPPFLVNYSAMIKAIRPMPAFPEPGFIDHH